jgi:hypothetical protein
MTPENLMQPRYKVIADYPNSEYVIGLVIDFAEESNFKSGKITGSNNVSEDFFLQYPNIFNKLRWFEDRDPKDMPEYVKEKEGNEVWRVEEYGAAVTCYVLLKKNFHDPEIPFGDHNLYDLLPATETEYLTYQNSLK